jgi:8-oxo-dGTP pyrophosphatase MutT (NUDIX family)
MRGSRKGTRERRIQYGALPYRVRGGARPEVMLVTSRETRRWIIPKGWPHRGKSPRQSAAREAFEEAGITGAIGRRPIGSFSYRKRPKVGRVVDCEVRVFALRVRHEHKVWPEREQRKVRWLPAGVAARAVHERQLGEIIRRFARTSDKAK